MRKILILLFVFALAVPALIPVQAEERAQMTWDYDDYRVTQITTTPSTDRYMRDDTHVPAWFDYEAGENNYLHGVQVESSTRDFIMVGDDWNFYFDETTGNDQFYRQSRYSDNPMLTFEFPKSDDLFDASYSAHNNTTYVYEYSEVNGKIHTQIYIWYNNAQWTWMFEEPRAGEWLVMTEYDGDYVMVNTDRSGDHDCFVDLYDRLDPDEACLPNSDNPVFMATVTGNEDSYMFSSRTPDFDRHHFIYVSTDPGFNNLEELEETDDLSMTINYFTTGGVYELDTTTDGEFELDGFYDSFDAVVVRRESYGKPVFDWLDPDFSMTVFRTETGDMEYDNVDGHITVKNCEEDVCTWTLYWDRDNYEVLDYEIIAVSEEMAVLNDNGRFIAHVRDADEYEIGYGETPVVFQEDNVVVWVGDNQEVYQATIYLSKAELEAGAVVKGSGSEVYYISEAGMKHLYPSEEIFYAYHNDFSVVQVISDYSLNQYPTGGNIRIVPGSIIKADGNAEVYYVTEQFEIREIGNEEIAEFFFGSDWKEMIITVPGNTLSDYATGELLDDKTDILYFTEV